MQSLLEKLLGTDLIALEILHEGKDQPGVHVFLHELSLSLPDLGFDLRGELQPHLAGAPDLHSFGPHLPDIFSGRFFIVQNKDLCFAFLTGNRQESPVPGPVAWQKTDLVGRPGEYALPWPVLRIPFIRSPVDLLLAAQEALYGLVALGIVGGQHFGQFDDPMALELLIDLAAFKILQVIREPVIIDGKKPEKRRFPGSLIPDYTDDIVELCTRFKHP